MEKLNNLVQAAVAFRQRMKTEGEAALKEAFAEFFNNQPEVGAIVWKQYTPYFSDGDACTFSRRDFEFLSPEDSQKKMRTYDDLCLMNRLNTLDFHRRHPQYGSGRCLTMEEQICLEAYKSFEKICSQIDDLFKTVFGDHVQVRATRDGFEVDDYDHD